MKFSMKFKIIKNSQTQAYCKTRNEILLSQELRFSKFRISDISLNSNLRVSNLTIFNTDLKAETFESVYENFDSISEDFRVVKVFKIKKKNVRESLRSKIVINEKFDNTSDLIRQYEWSNSNENQNWDDIFYSLRVYLVMKKKQNFRKHD